MKFDLRLAAERWGMGLGTGLAYYLTASGGKLDVRLAAGYMLVGLLTGGAVDFHAYRQGSK